MSNVLIGIIGVILFIGLALAGALFLGPQFQQSTNSAKGSASVQAVSQVASAVNMENVQTGTQTLAAATSLTDLVTATYLKSVPGNPVVAANAPTLIDANYKTHGNNAATWAVMDLGSGGDPVCLAIARQSGQALATDTTSPSGTVFPASPSGCIHMTAATGNVAASYIAFAAI